MVAPAAAAAVPVAITAGSLAKPVLQGLFADLAVIRTQKPRRGKPVEVEYHVNPGAIGLTAVGIGLALWLCQLRLRPTTDETGKITGITLASRAGFGIEGTDVTDYLSPAKDPVGTVIVASPIGIVLRYFGVI